MRLGKNGRSKRHTIILDEIEFMVPIGFWFIYHSIDSSKCIWVFIKYSNLNLFGFNSYSSFWHFFSLNMVETFSMFSWFARVARVCILQLDILSADLFLSFFLLSLFPSLGEVFVSLISRAFWWSCTLRFPFLLQPRVLFVDSILARLIPFDNIVQRFWISLN